MSIFGKKYQKNDDSTKPMKASKTVVGFGASVVLSYASYKYGYPMVGHIFDFSHYNISAIGNELGIFVMSSIVGIIGGLGIEAIRSAESTDSNYHFLNVVKYSSVLPIISLAAISYFEPSATDFLLNIGQITAKGLVGSALAVTASVGIISPIFSKQIGHALFAGTEKLSVFNTMTEKFTQYFIERKLKKALNSQNDLSSAAIEKNKENGIDIVLNNILDRHQTLSLVISNSFRKYNIDRNAQNTLNSILTQAQYIVKHATLETLEYRQEVLSLYGTILPQIMKSFDCSLENANNEERQGNNEKLKQSLGRIEEHFGRLENILRENQKVEKNMDFDSAINFADARFKLINNNNQSNTKKMNLSG
jgi:hypothetical protein